METAKGALKEAAERKEAMDEADKALDSTLQAVARACDRGGPPGRSSASSMMYTTYAMRIGRHQVHQSPMRITIESPFACR